MYADSEKPNIIGVIGRNIALWQNLWVGVGRFERRSSSTRASLALCGRFDQFRSPYSWITMRKALRKRRVFDFVPSYLNTKQNNILMHLEPKIVSFCPVSQTCENFSCERFSHLRVIGRFCEVTAFWNQQSDHTAMVKQRSWAFLGAHADDTLVWAVFAEKRRKTRVKKARVRGRLVRRRPLGLTWQVIPAQS